MLQLSEKFEKFPTTIQKKNININEFDIKLLNKQKDGPEVLEYTFNNLLKKQNYHFDKSFKDIININRFYFLGEIETENYYSSLEINIENITSNLRLLNYDEKLWFEGQPEDEKALWKTFRSFDTRPDIGDGKMAVFSIQEGVSPSNEPAIYYIDRAFYCKTSLTFVGYYEAVLDMMGIADWQLLFSDVLWNDPQVEDYYPGLKASLEALSKAFPEKDYTKYFELLEAKWV